MGDTAGEDAATTTDHLKDLNDMELEEEVEALSKDQMFPEEDDAKSPEKKKKKRMSKAEKKAAKKAEKEAAKALAKKGANSNKSTADSSSKAPSSLLKERRYAGV
jgi:hypothetical protein